MEEVMKLLGPWPVLQFFFGVSILALGVFMVIKGIQKKEPLGSAMSQQLLEDKRSEWLAYEQLKNIEENSHKTVRLLSQIYDRLNNNADQMKALSAAIWNRREGL